MIASETTDLFVRGPRIGTIWLDIRSEGHEAMLHDTGKQIELVVTYEHDHPWRRRFVGRAATFGDDPDYELHDYGWPDQVWFRDAHGVVCLVGPHHSSASFSSICEGRVRFSFALDVGDPGIAYTKVNALRSRIEGLEEWMPISCVSHERVTGEAGTGADVLTLRRRDDVPFGRRLNAALLPTYKFTVSPVPGQSAIEDRIVTHTAARRPRSWDDHLALHQSLRALLVVAGWRNYGFRSLQAQRTDDPVRALARNVLGQRWAPVHTYTLPRPDGATATRSQFLFDFDDIGALGMGRWTRLYGAHMRGIKGMIHSLETPGMALETAIAEAGAALEFIGHGIAIERGESPGQKFRIHLGRVTTQVHTRLPFDLDDWILRFAEAYMSVKHPDRKQMESLALANSLREARLVFRAWVAARLGVSRANLERNLNFIPMRRPFEQQ